MENMPMQLKGRSFLLTSLIIHLLFVNAIRAHSQAEEDSLQVLLLENISIQVQATEAINNMYNFNFTEAEKHYKKLKYDFPHHPLSYFLLALSEWWKINVNIQNTEYDETFLAYIDTALTRAHQLYEIPQYRVESAFFLAAGYGFQGRLYAERHNWGKAAVAGRNSLKYLEDSKEKGYLSPELLFGDAIFNYFSIWIAENYPLLKPVLAFFPKGDKKLGLEQLRHVSRNAFYTRTEAQYFLMRILASEENDLPGALQVSQYLHQTFPYNPYFHRYYARMLYSTGQFNAVETISKEILTRIDSSMLGYEAVSGRYASFYLGQVNEQRRDYASAKHYYERAIVFARKVDATEAGYYLHSMLSLGEIAMYEGDEELAKDYFKQVKKDARRRDGVHKRARSLLKEM